MSIETQLREALAARAEELSPTHEDAYARVSGAVRTSQLRRRAATVGALAALAAVAVVVPNLASSSQRTTTPAHTQTVVPGPSDPRWSSMATWPTRGGLAGDRALVSAVADKAAGHVVFIDDIGSARVAVTVSDEPAQVSVLEGPAGAPLEELRVTSTSDGGDWRDRAVVVTLDKTRLVAISRPDVRVMQVSASPTLHPDGSISRTWRNLTLRDGVATPDDVPAPLLRVRVAGYDGPPSFALDQRPEGDPEASICVDLCRDFTQKAAAAVTESVADTFGLEPTQVATSVVYSGPVDPVVAGVAGVTDASAGELRLLVTHSELPGGQLLRSAILVHSTANGTGESMELETGVPIDAATAQGRPFVLHGPDHSGAGILTEVIAPSAAAVRFTSGAPSLYPDSAKVTVVDGKARVVLPESTGMDHRIVVTYDASGRELGRWPATLANASDPYDLQP